MTPSKWQCIRKNGLTLDEMFVWMKKIGATDEKILRMYIELTGDNEHLARRTLKNKNQNHIFYTTGVKSGFWHFSQGHHRACLRYDIMIHPIAKTYANETWKKVTPTR